MGIYNYSVKIIVRLNINKNYYMLCNLNIRLNRYGIELESIRISICLYMIKYL